MHTEDELFEMIQKKIHVRDECWLWMGGTDNNGRPKLYMNFVEENGRRQESILPHKYLYVRLYGDCGARYYDNTCGDLRCVNPEHHVPRTIETTITKRVSVDQETGCWNWTGGLFESGYGRVTKDGRSQVAHRVSYEHFNGPVPKGLYICHKCNNRRCVNPEHLYVGSHEDNTRDMLAAGTSSRGERNGQSILKKEMVIEIKKLIKSKELSYRKIARKFGVSYSAIKDIASGRTWSWVEEE